MMMRDCLWTMWFAWVAVVGTLSGAEDLFSGALQNPAAWKIDPKIKATVPPGGGLLLEQTALPGTVRANYPVAVPAELRGKPVMLEITVKNTAPLVWGNNLRIAQFDAAGKRLPESVTDPRFISFMLPVGKIQTHRERGRIHPQAAKIAFVCELRGVNVKFGPDGNLLKNPADALPRLLIGDLKLTPIAEGEGFPVNPEFFVPGVSGTNDDCALDLHDSREFFYATRSQAVWAENYQERDPDNLFWPVGAGTVEMWLKPEWKNAAENIILFSTANHVPGSPWGKSRGTLCAVEYRPAAKTVSVKMKDEANKVFTGQGALEISEGVWSHIAFCWTPGGKGELFLNGKSVLTVALPGYKKIDLTVKGDPNSQGAQEFILGGDYLTARVNKGFTDENELLRGAVDNLRISSTVRYTGDFTPAKSFAKDAATRALFAFNKSYDGVSGGGCGRISGSLVAKEPRVLYGGKKELGPELDHRKVISILNFPDVPTADDFRRARKTITQKFTLTPGGKQTITCPAGVRPDFVEIANRGAAPIVHPYLRRADEIDTRSFDGIRKTLGLDGLSDREKANKVFQFVVRNQDYFMAHAVNYAPGSDSPQSYHENVLLQLNSYPGCQCGGLNYVTAHLFAIAADLPSAPQQGYGHLFEHVWFDGSSHVYDASWQYYCPHFNNLRAARLDEIEREPGMMRRFERSVGHYIRHATRGGGAATPKYCAPFAVTLNPGERFRWWFANDGQLNNVGLGSKQYTPHPLTQDCTKISGSQGRAVFRQNRLYPEFGNGFLVFEGRPDAHNPAFAAVSTDSFIYKVDTRYPVAHAEYSGEKVELSTDDGKTWRVFTSDYQLKGRTAFLVKVSGTGVAARNFRAVTEVMMNRRVLTGNLRPGENVLHYSADSAGSADITVQYREPAQIIEIAGGVQFGTIPGEERQMVAVEPGAELSLTVKGVGSTATARSTDPALGAMLTDGKLVLKPDGKIVKPYFANVILRDNDAEKTLTVLVGKNVRLAVAADAKPLGTAQIRPADNAQPQASLWMTAKDDGADFAFAPLPKGDYMIYEVIRQAGNLQANPDFNRRPLLARFPWAKGKKNKTVTAAGGIGAGDFYKARYGKTGARGPFKWDYPGNPQTGYPLRKAGTFAFPETRNLEFRLAYAVPEGLELAGVLVVPDADFDFYGELMKNLSNLNYAPARVAAGR